MAEDMVNDVQNIAVELRGITKTFGNFIANDNIDFDVRYGEVHGLLGENGAGKSTLMNVLYGLLRPDSGQIIVNGAPRVIRGAHDAMNLGIQMVHQHFMLALPNKSWENVVLGAEPIKNKLFIDRKKSFAEMRRAATLCGFEIDPSETVGNMPVASRQKLEIVRALYHKCNVIILDEPTAVLSVNEADELINLIQKLKEDGKAIILITHKLRETMKACDRVTVLRHGKVVITENIANVTTQSLATAMVGRPVLFELPERLPVLESETVKFINVTTGKSKANLHDATFAVNSGEIFGIAGVEGNGQRDLVASLLGLCKLTSGKIEITGKEISKMTPAQCNKCTAHIAEDRHSQGYIESFSIVENVLLGRQDEPSFRRNIWTKQNAIIEQTKEIIQKFDVRINSIFEPAGSLSGGNQQKLLVGREFTKPGVSLIIAEHPSRGLDIASTEYVHQCLIDMRNKGKSIILITADLDELFSLSDRIGILFNGRFVAFGRPDEFTPEVLGMFMTGGGAV